MHGLAKPHPPSPIARSLRCPVILEMVRKGSCDSVNGIAARISGMKTKPSATAQEFPDYYERLGGWNGKPSAIGPRSAAARAE
jgi:hypothetical protein